MSVDRPDLPQGEVTFLFTDIEGSTRLLQRHGGVYASLLSEHHRIVRASLAAHRGVEVSTDGDAFFAVFPSASDAVSACLDAQRTLASHPWPDGGVIRVRMGLHTGLGELHEGDYVGLAVHQAARIAAAAHGGQVVMSVVTADCAGELPEGVSLKVLGEFTLRGFDEPARLLQLCHAELGRDFRPLRALPAGAHNIVRPRTTFVGRERELAELHERLRGVSMLTLIGPGGVGKTRLAQELALSAASTFADGVYQVELASTTGDEALSEVARVVGVAAESDQPLGETLPLALERRSLLLLLDNCEHVLDAVAELADLLLGACPAVVILATSRERIAVDGEFVWPVKPLAPPSEAAGPPELRANAAAMLLCDRASASAPGFAINAGNASAITSICRRLDGLPLALELAAAQLGALSPKDVAAALARRFETGTGGLRTAPPRQRTLQATIAWSYDLLNELEQRTLRTLAVFAGRFEAGDAAAVYRNAWNGEAPALAELVTKSLVTREEDTYRLLESVRAYARVKRAEHGEVETARNGYMTWILDLVEQADGEEVSAYWARLQRSYLELRAALEWAVAAELSTELIAICARAGRFLAEPHILDARGWMEAALRLSDGADPVDVAWVKARLSFVLGVTERGTQPRAIALGQSALEAFRTAGNDEGVCETLVILAAVFVAASDFDAARDHASRALALAERSGRRDLQYAAFSNLGLAAHESGAYDEARRLWEGAMAIAEDSFSLAHIRVSLAQSDLVAGASDRALEHVLAALPTLRAVESTHRVRDALAVAACALVDQKRYSDAATLFAAVYAFRRYGDAHLDDVIQLVKPALAKTRASLDPASLGEAWQSGEALTLNQAVTLVLERCTPTLAIGPVSPRHSEARTTAFTHDHAN